MVSSIDELIARVESLEQRRWCQSSSSARDDDDKDGVTTIVDEAMRRARRSVEQLGVYSAVWKFVPEPYYAWPLQERAKCLEAPSIQYLCKSLLMENRKAAVAKNDDKDDPTNPRFLLVVIHVDDNRIITGFEHNSVTPFGMLRPDIPIVLSSALEPFKFFWMGGGHVHLKLGASFTEFCRALHPIVADISQPRSAADILADTIDES